MPKLCSGTQQGFLVKLFFPSSCHPLIISQSPITSIMYSLKVEEKTHHNRRKTVQINGWHGKMFKMKWNVVETNRTKEKLISRNKKVIPSFFSQRSRQFLLFLRFPLFCNFSWYATIVRFILLISREWQRRFCSIMTNSYYGYDEAETQQCSQKLLGRL